MSQFTVGLKGKEVTNTLEKGRNFGDGRTVTGRLLKLNCGFSPSPLHLRGSWNKTSNIDNLNPMK
eukprot:scaffold191_cov189-Alexandrium_tamarense.AAC.4